MLILDTDHFSELVGSRSSASRQLFSRLQAVADPVAITIITVEEMLRGWLATIHKSPSPHDQIRPYERLGKLCEVVAEWQVITWDQAAVNIFEQLRPLHRRMGTMDLKIAAIAVAHRATVLTRNQVDFSPISELRCENWLS